LLLELFRQFRVPEFLSVEIDNGNAEAVFDFAFAEIVQAWLPLAVLLQIFRGSPGDKDVARIPTIHHPLRHVDSRTRYVGTIVNVGKPAYWAAVDTHPHTEFRMTL
jgi:hypothetical protein